ncbi:SapC protein [Desulfonatronum zhilinae]|nr:SapC protein [Desulfonatronum zhilinae]
MPNYVLVSKETHSPKRWKRYESYAYAMSQHVLGLVAAELPKAALAFPIGFLQQNSDFFPVALLGLHPGKNLFVAANGQWVGSYVPSALRSYPFQLARTEDGQAMLCVDEDSDVITDGPDGEAFFDDTGEPSEAVKQVLNFLNHVEQNRVATASACATLARHDLIVPWPITIKTETGEQNIQGLYQIDESKLSQLPDEAFLELRKSGALPIAYCQMLSMQHLPMLGKLIEAHAKADTQTQAAQGGGIKAEISFDDDMIRFS